MITANGVFRSARRAAIAAMVATCAATAPTRAVTWIHDTVIAPGGLAAVCIAADSAGLVHLSGWCPQTQSMSYGFWNGADWSLEPLEALPASPQTSTITLDAEGRPHVAWAGEDPASPGVPALRHAVRDLGVWSITTVDAGPASVGRLPSMATRGAAWVIAYEGWPGELRCARWNGSVWMVESVDETGFDESASQRVSAAIGPDGTVHLAYRSEDPDTLGLRYARRGEAGWEVRSLADGPVGHWVTLALDAEGRVGFAHAERGASASRLLYSWLEGTVLTTVVVDDTSVAGDQACHQLDRWGQPHVVYQRGVNGCVRYARRCGDTWQIEAVDDTCSPGPLWMSLDRAARAHLVYGRATGALVHTHAAPLANGATHVVVAPAGTGTEFRVAAVDAGGSPVPGAEIVVDFSGCPDVALCRAGGGEDYGYARGRYRVRAFADCFGERRFHVRGGGRSTPACATVWVNGEITGSFPVASPDANGDLDVDASDQAALLGCFGTMDPRCDMDGDGLVDAVDLAIVAAALGTSCPSAVAAEPPSAAALVLASIAPNPGAGPVELAFAQPRRGPVRLVILDVLGRRIRTLLDGEALTAGPHRRTWDGRDDAGTRVPPGVYRVRLAGGGDVRTGTIVRVR